MYICQIKVPDFRINIWERVLDNIYCKSGNNLFSTLSENVFRISRMLSRWDLSPHLLWEIKVDQFINYLLKSFFFFHTVSYHREDKIKSIEEQKNTCSWNQLILDSLKTVRRNLILLCLMLALLVLKITSLVWFPFETFVVCLEILVPVFRINIWGWWIL